MAISPLAGKLPPKELLIDADELVRQYFDRQPDMSDFRQRVVFGTSGHRGCSADGSFNEAHILAISQAICEHRKSQNIDGPLYLAKDTHAVDTPAHNTALEVFAANGVEVIVAAEYEYTPVPVVSHAILSYNHGRTTGLADGVIVTPSHNPPRDGGIKYNPPTAGPADVDATKAIENRANQLLEADNAEVKRFTFERALAARTTHSQELFKPYVDDLASVIDMEAIKQSGLTIGADPLGGASVHLWEWVRDKYGLDITIVNPYLDFTFKFMRVDHDGIIRMDCSSPYAMAGLVGLKDRFNIAFGNDTDADRHGIVAPSVGLLPPNHNLAVSMRYLFTNRPEWPKDAKIGKTLVSSMIIDRLGESIGRGVYEVPVGFKWFVDGLFKGSLGFVGEESAGATFLKKDGAVWTTDKDGPLMDLLACEITAVTGKDPGEHYREIEQKLGTSYYSRVDQSCTLDQAKAISKLTPESVKHTTVAGEKIESVIDKAPGNNAPIGGLKVSTLNGWFAVRPSGTEPIYKIYAESLQSEEHLGQIFGEAREIVGTALKSS
jgi:phosphoglucomutase